MDKDKDLIAHIIEHIEDIFAAQRRFGNDGRVFSQDKAYFNAVCMSLLQIGELSRHLTTPFTAAHQDIPWRNIIGLRNIVAHGYGSLDPNTVWDTVIKDIPGLHQKCRVILSTTL